MKALSISSGFAAAFMLATLLSSCSTLYVDHCADEANVDKTDATRLLDGPRCEDGLLSPKRSRAMVYQGDDSPRLWTGEAARKQTSFDPSALNQPPGIRAVPAIDPASGDQHSGARGAARAPVTGYVDSHKVEYPSDPKMQAADIASVRSAGSRFDPDEEITALNFDNKPLDYFLDQLLHGALGVNYIAPPNMERSVTLRTEQPLRKVQVLQVVRDVLSRNGLEMRLMNGVYQIAPPDVISSLGQISASGRTGERDTEVVHLSKGNATELVGVVKQLVSEDVTLAVNGGDSIVVHAQPTDVGKVVGLIKTLSDSGFSENYFDIIRLHGGAPEKVAAQLSEFYRERLRRGAIGGVGADIPTLVPLENQQAILIGTKDRRIMQEIRQLAARLDTGGGVDDISLRIIPLLNLTADEVTQQLNAIFTAGNNAGQNQVGSRQSQGTSSGLPSSQYSSQGPGAPEINLSTGLPAIPVPVPQASPGVPGFNLGNNSASDGNAGRTTAGESEGGSVSNARESSAGGSNSAPGREGVGTFGVKIVADNRSNAVWVYSNYALFRRIQDVLRVLDVPQSQVVIEATIAEVDLNDTLEHGVQAFLQSTGITARSSSAPNEAGAKNITGNGAMIDLSATIGGANAQLVLTALQQVTTTKVISSPYLTVLDGKTARLEIGDQVPFAQTTQNATITGALTVTQQIVVKDTGIVLEVTPRIKSNNSALLNIDQRVSSVKGSQDQSGATPSLTPTISRQEIKSDILVQSGRTILLGGLIKESVHKDGGGVPVLMSIPGVGDLFRQNTDAGARQELIVMITPRVIRHTSQIEDITRMLRGQLHIR